MSEDYYRNNATYVWHNLLKTIVDYGEESSPRGKPILELPHRTIMVNMNRPVVLDPLRRMNYKFMAAEASWMVAGRDDVGYLTQYNPKMAEFSDDGRVLAGAYGPKIRNQMLYVIDKLIEDRDTRQATMSLWTPNPLPSKDIPCTTIMDFKIRSNVMNMHVFMRSSDAWLGVPYDVFSFSCVAASICSHYNYAMVTKGYKEKTVKLGTLYLTAASSHLYDNTVPLAYQVFSKAQGTVCNPMPPTWWDGSDDVNLVAELAEIAESHSSSHLRWWK